MRVSFLITNSEKTDLSPVDKQKDEQYLELCFIYCVSFVKVAASISAIFLFIVQNMLHVFL